MAKKIKRKQVEGLDNVDTSNLLQKGGYDGTAKQLKDEIDGKAPKDHTHSFSDLKDLPKITKEENSNKDLDYSVGSLGKITVPQVENKSKWFINNENLFGLFYSPNLLWDNCTYVREDNSIFTIATDFYQGTAPDKDEYSYLKKGVYLFCFDLADGITPETLGDISLSFIEKDTNNEIPIVYKKLSHNIYIIDNREQQYSTKCTKIKISSKSFGGIRHLQFRALSEIPFFDYSCREHKTIQGGITKTEEYDYIEYNTKNIFSVFTEKIKNGNRVAGLSISSTSVVLGPHSQVDIGSDEGGTVNIKSPVHILLKSDHEIHLVGTGGVMINGSSVVTSGTIYGILEPYSNRIDALEREVQEMRNKIYNIESFLMMQGYSPMP